MNEKLIQSYVADRFFVSTIRRECSAMLMPTVFFETISWAWDPVTKKRGKCVDEASCSDHVETALRLHLEVCTSLMMRTE